MSLTGSKQMVVGTIMDQYKLAKEVGHEAGMDWLEEDFPEIAQ